MADISIPKVELSVLNARAWSYIIKRAFYGDFEAKFLIGLIEGTQPAPNDTSLVPATTVDRVRADLAQANQVAGEFNVAETVHRLLRVCVFHEIQGQPHKAALCRRAATLLQQQEDELDALRSIVADKNLEDDL
jgi:hypothetical protein